jgi:hypothetical protein
MHISLFHLLVVISAFLPHTNIYCSVMPGRLHSLLGILYCIHRWMELPTMTLRKIKTLRNQEKAKKLVLNKYNNNQSIINTDISRVTIFLVLQTRTLPFLHEKEDGSQCST